MDNNRHRQTNCRFKGTVLAVGIKSESRKSQSAKNDVSISSSSKQNKASNSEISRANGTSSAPSSKPKSRSRYFQIVECVASLQAKSGNGTVVVCIVCIIYTNATRFLRR
jgi:histone deacetylase complex regulatory component SIN3